MAYRMMIAVGLVLLLIGGLAAVATATPPDGQICPALDSGKIDTTGDPLSVTFTAPDGYLIDGFCVKAGSATQGLGAEFVTVDPPQKTVTITHSSGKAVSHYSVSYVKVPPTTTTTVPETTTTTVPETTTTTVPETTTTTVPETTTTIPETTTTVPEETTTVPEEVTTTTVDPCDENSPFWDPVEQDCILAFTGPVDWLWPGGVLLALGAVTAGIGVLGATRRESFVV